MLTPEERVQAQQVLHEFGQDQEGSGAPQGNLFNQFKDAFVLGAGQQVGKLCVSGAMALVTGGASLILEGVEPVTEAGRGIRAALQQAWNHFSQDPEDG